MHFEQPIVFHVCNKIFLHTITGQYGQSATTAPNYNYPLHLSHMASVFGLTGLGPALNNTAAKGIRLLSIHMTLGWTKSHGSR